MMQAVHAAGGTTFSSINGRGESEPDKRACLSLPAPERMLALNIDSDNRTTHATIGERPMDQYRAYDRRPYLRVRARPSPPSGRQPPPLRPETSRSSLTRQTVHRDAKGDRQQRP